MERTLLLTRESDSQRRLTFRCLDSRARRVRLHHFPPTRRSVVLHGVSNIEKFEEIVSSRPDKIFGLRALIIDRTFRYVAACRVTLRDR